MAWMRGRLLGAGAFGSVNLAMRREDGEVFAVKSVVVREAGEVAVRAIENEIRVLEEVESRHVVRCLGSDWTTEGGELMRNVLLEYMPGGCLTDFVKQFGGGLDEHLLRTYTRSIVEGLDYLHGKGIVHCDVKGKNVLVGNGNDVKLTDFGSAKRVGDGEGEDQVRGVNGTPLWMAPEVVRQVEQGPASDIWSLGCTVVEMATGRAPWSNLAGMNHFVALYHIGCTDELPAVPASLSEDAHDFLSHCFQRDPRKRWTSAQLLQHPFLTTRFTPPTTPTPSSPISVLQFPDADTDVSASSSFVNSVPTLAAPSLFKRGLVSTPPKLEVNNWWSTPAGPDSGPWIVVRSPKSTSSDWMSTPAADSPAPPVVATVVKTPEFFMKVSSSVMETSSFPEQGDLSHGAIHLAATGLAISEVASCAAPLRRMRESWPSFTTTDSACHGVAEKLELEEDFLKPDLNLGRCIVALIKGTINEYSELVYQYSNPQILLYWWHSHYRKRLDLHSSNSSCSENHRTCIIHFLDQSTFIHLNQTSVSRIHVCLVCVFWFYASFTLFLFWAMADQL